MWFEGTIFHKGNSATELCEDMWSLYHLWCEVNICYNVLLLLLSVRGMLVTQHHAPHHIPPSTVITHHLSQSLDGSFRIFVVKSGVCSFRSCLITCSQVVQGHPLFCSWAWVFPWRLVLLVFPGGVSIWLSQFCRCLPITLLHGSTFASFVHSWLEDSEGISQLTSLEGIHFFL